MHPGAQTDFHMQAFEALAVALPLSSGQEVVF